ncbi:MAG: M20/M25/M40 family metallo-hydrolase, partial [Actinomycetia bacterium]|nr:M20/M25/M40 family metallo-hydrolase [Actinomycetes bacterium]
MTRTHKVLGPAATTVLDGPRAFGGEIDNMVAAVNQLSYSGMVQTLENFVTRYSYTSTCDTAGDWIYNQLTGFGLSAERHYFPISSYTRFNIIATLPGLVSPDEVVFICGHYDSTSEDPYNLAPGADDNGSGTTAMIETARILSNYSFERTIKFAAWAGEEQGLVGSAAYVAEAAAAGMNVVAVYNLDMIGYSGTDTAPPDMVIYTNASSLPVANLLSDAITYYVPTEVEPVIDTSALTASDHASFWNHGYQAILGIEDEAWGDDFSPVYHSTGDTVANCDLAYATACTKASLAAVAETAIPFTPAGMHVSPVSNFVTEGPNGGPFTPATFDYTLTNYENFALDYTVSESAAWLDAAPAAGTIPALGSVMVTLSINSAANSLADGPYSAVVDFVNTTNHIGDTTRTADLTVGVPVMQYQWNMDSNPGWTTEGQWAYGVPTGGGGAYGNPDPSGGATGANVYGYNLSGDYANDLNETHLTSTAIDCSALNSVILKFQRYLNVEQPTYDHAYVRVSNDNSNWTIVWQNTVEVTDSSWSQVEYDISAVADGQSTVYLRWTMGDTDGGWTYSGWNLDDVEVWGIDGSAQPTDTVAATLGCQPGSGTLPFTVGFTAGLENLTGGSRRAAAHIDLLIAGGSFYANWRAGWTNLSPAELYTTSWSQNLPSLGSLVG